MKVLLLVTGGRGGSDFFQGLLDGHQEIIQFPGILRPNKKFKEILKVINFYKALKLLLHIVP